MGKEVKRGVGGEREERKIWGEKGREEKVGKEMNKEEKCRWGRK